MLNSALNKPSTQGIISILNDFNITCPASIDLSAYHGDLTNDSRTVGKNDGDIFCAIIGHKQDGRLYIENAIESGAKLVLSECETEAEHSRICFTELAQKQIPIISFYQLNKALFSLASAYYHAPEKNMTMIGITGTNGKTSTSQLLGQMLTRCHKPCAIIGTNGAGMVDALNPLENTTPSATDLMQLFHHFNAEKIAGQKISHIAMEVSSHALEQKRVLGSTFDIAVFTNLSRDHLDYHNSMANYAEAKRQLFTYEQSQIAVLNGDDEQVQQWLEHWPVTNTLPKENVWLYGRNDQVKAHTHFVSCKNIQHLNHGIEFLLQTHLGDIKMTSPLLGDFNIDNLLAVISVLLIEGVSLTAIAETSKHIKPVAGRMEAFSLSSSTQQLSKQAPTAVVDYAHTPDALEKALIACRQHCQGELFVVFGCGGDRDKGKRPLMAKAAEKYADNIVITNDNPRTEEPMAIINDVLAGLSQQKQVSVIIDRQQAVITTLSKAQGNDVVLLAGKGHEDYLILGHNKIAYNERQIVQDFYDNFPKHVVKDEQL